MEIPKGLRWLIWLVVFLEARIESLLERLGNAKERLLVPLIQRFWPSWLLPNHLTAGRFWLSIGIIVWLCLTGAEGYKNNNWLAGMVIVACLTDLIDGLVARALKCESRLGSLFDKIVDKLLILPLGSVEFWPLARWLVILSIGGTVIVTVAATYKYLQETEEVPENVIGKCGMILYSLGIIIAIWPTWQDFALKIAWIGFGLGGVSILINFRRHFAPKLMAK